MSKTYALILAGGSGTRFWPLSRNDKPKQLLNLFGNATMLEQTVQRIEGVVPPENILILTNEIQEAGVKEVTKGIIPEENIFTEPARRDTAPAVALGIGLVAAKDPDANMIALPADHLIEDQKSFQKVINDAITIAQESHALLTIGIKPTWACPSFGYIERGEAVETTTSTKNTAYEVLRFREKPAPELAEKFLSQGGFSWNAGMFIWNVKDAIREIQTAAPDLDAFITKIVNSTDVRNTIQEFFPVLSPISIDYALMERASKVYNMEATFDWDDLGSWISVGKYLENRGGNIVANTEITEHHSDNNIIYSTQGDLHVGLVGVDNLIVVKTNDALLICDRREADSIKKLVGKLPKELL